MSEAVVDRLEAVEVEEEQRSALAIGSLLGQRLGYPLSQLQSIRQRGQRIVMRQKFQSRFALLDLAYVGEDPDIVDDLAPLVARGVDRQPLGIAGAVFAAVPDLALPMTAITDISGDVLVKAGAVPA